MKKKKKKITNQVSPFSQFEAILERGFAVQSGISIVAKQAIFKSIEKSIEYRHCTVISSTTIEISLDFSEINKKVHKSKASERVLLNLPKGVRIVG